VNDGVFNEPLTNASILGRAPELADFYNTEGGRDCNKSLARTIFTDSLPDTLADYHANRASFKNVSLLECMQAYNDPFTFRPNVFLVTRDNNSFSNLCMRFDVIEDAGWTVRDFAIQDPGMSPKDFYSKTICEYSWDFVADGYCGLLARGALTAEQVKLYRTRGYPWDFSVDRCIYNPTTSTSKTFQTQHECHLQCSPPILFVVALFNGIKCLCILWIILRCDRHTLNTIGDVVAAFLERPDPYTADFGAITRDAVTNTKAHHERRRGKPVVWEKKAVRWWRAAEPVSWGVSLFFFLATIAAASFFFHAEIMTQQNENRDGSLAALWKLGFGEANAMTLISWRQVQGVSNLSHSTGLILICCLHVIPKKEANFADTRSPVLPT